MSPRAKEKNNGTRTHLRHRFAIALSTLAAYPAYRALEAYKQHRVSAWCMDVAMAFAMPSGGFMVYYLTRLEDIKLLKSQIDSALYDNLSAVADNLWNLAWGLMGFALFFIAMAALVESIRWVKAVFSFVVVKKRRGHRNAETHANSNRSSAVEPDGVPVIPEYRS